MGNNRLTCSFVKRLRWGRLGCWGRGGSGGSHQLFPVKISMHEQQNAPMRAEKAIHRAPEESKVDVPRRLSMATRGPPAESVSSDS